MTPEDERHLRRSFDLAREARARGDGAFGAVLLAAGGAGGVFEARNTAPTTGDASAHAEMNALREAAKRRGGPALKGATLYASCEPCPMCATAAHLAGVSRVVFGIRAAARRGDSADFGRKPAARRAVVRQHALRRRNH